VSRVETLYQLQSRRGYRANTDSWVLAYVAWSNLESPTSDILTVTDLGAGHGLASIAFGLRSQRTASLRLVEFQEQLAARACQNMELNGISGYDVRVHDIQHELPADLCGIADVVLCNPPFYKSSARLPPKMIEKRLAHFETSAGISHFMMRARSAVTPTGSVFIIYDILNVERLIRACREAGLFVSFAQEVMHREGSSTGRAVVRATPVNDGRTRSTMWEDNMTLHSPEYEEPLYRPEIEAFFAALPPPVLDIGRLEFVGCPSS
jgi:tRNA1Val (adenine37-N6)-methyltransferase